MLLLAKIWSKCPLQYTFDIYTNEKIEISVRIICHLEIWNFFFRHMCVVNVPVNFAHSFTYKSTGMFPPTQAPILNNSDVNDVSLA